MLEKYKFSKRGGLYFVTLTVVNWIEIFTRKEPKHTNVRSLILLD
jgi:hypothetical protein